MEAGLLIKQYKRSRDFGMKDALW